MKHIVVGTAGHIDHGKTALVRALTGIDTDRLEEEKRRGISIDLGFAHLNLSDSIRLAFIDVPGHERFIKNMLAGAGSVDAVLLVVAADESVKPQTREHFDICRLLRIPRGVIALTKSDLVDPDIVELVRLEVEEFLADSFLEGAPIVPVSSVTGDGLEQLRGELRRIAEEVTPKDASEHFRMPIDRVFLRPGFGTVVTGTVVGGIVDREAEVQVHPGGHALRVRGIQVHGTAAKRAIAGQRAALNLAGTELESLTRGTMLAATGKFRSTARIDCIFELLQSAKPLKNRAPVHLHAGTAEVLAEVRTLDGSGTIQPGSSTAVRVVLREPLLLVPGDRFIVRMFSPVVTIGGGEVVDPQPPRRAVGAFDRTLSLSRSSLADRVARLVSEAEFGLSVEELEIRTGVTAAVMQTSLPSSVFLMREPQPWMFDREWLRSTVDRWRRILADFHRANPLARGLGREELRSRELAAAPLFVFDAVLVQDRTIVSSGDVLHLASHKIAFKQDEEQALSKIESAFALAGLAVPGVKEVLDSSGVDAARAKSLLQILLRNRRLVKVTEDLVFHPEAVSALRQLMANRRGQRFSVPEFKDWTGISRKYAIPLLEFLDREKVTRRDGDSRLVL
jgi:selenocysteine-specific elongation factor